MWKRFLAYQLRSKYICIYILNTMYSIIYSLQSLVCIIILNSKVYIDLKHCGVYNI